MPPLSPDARALPDLPALRRAPRVFGHGDTVTSTPGPRGAWPSWPSSGSAWPWPVRSPPRSPGAPRAAAPRTSSSSAVTPTSLDDPVGRTDARGTRRRARRPARRRAGSTATTSTRPRSRPRGRPSPGRRDAPVVFLVSGESQSKGYAAVPAAAVLGGPVLLTRPDGIPRVTAAELKRLDPERIVARGRPLGARARRRQGGGRASHRPSSGSTGPARREPRWR